MLVRACALTAFAVFSAIPSCAHAADAPPSAEAAILRAMVIGKCHQPLTGKDKAYGEILRASLQVELDRIWMELRAANPSENVHTAYEIFSEWFDKAKAAAEMKVEGGDCAELERQATPTDR